MLCIFLFNFLSFLITGWFIGVDKSRQPATKKGQSRGESCDSNRRSRNLFSGLLAWRSPQPWITISRASQVNWKIDGEAAVTRNFANSKRLWHFVAWLSADHKLSSLNTFYLLLIIYRRLAENLTGLCNPFSFCTSNFSILFNNCQFYFLHS